MIPAILVVLMILIPAGAFFGLRIILHYAFFHPPVPCENNPGDLGMSYETHFVKTASGKQVQTFFTGRENTGPLIIAIHGWENTSDKFLPLAKYLTGKNFRVVLLNTRNHGASDSDGYSTMVKYSEDLTNTCDNYRQLLKDDVRIVLVGHSLGAATSIYVASKRSDISAVVAIAGFADMETVLLKTFRKNRIPAFLGPFIIEYLEKKIGAPLHDLAPKNRITDLTIPVLIIHGDKDNIIPLEDAERIVASSGNKSTRLWINEGGNHSSMLTETEFFKQVAGFVQEALENHV